MVTNNNAYEFDISLSVLEHLGRNLYRNFITVLGEAISNSWDADAKNVWIDIDRKNKKFTIKDDGIGMDEPDFKEKFLRVGYSKRAPDLGGEPKMSSPGGRPFIGSKGIGKLALLSCSEIVSIISKKSGIDDDDPESHYVGGVVDNNVLDNAIKDDLTYKLGPVERELIQQHEGHKHGTIIQFRNLKPNIRNTTPYLRKMIAIHFRFSLVDEFKNSEEFNIHLDGELITLNDLKELSDSTEFLWNIGNFKDPFIDDCKLEEGALIDVDSNLIEGFIATVDVPSNLKIRGTEEKASVDLFVNGRLRERDLLKNIPTARIAESYMYGQIHFNALDSDEKDRFTSSREGVLESDEQYQSLLNELGGIVPKAIHKWDELRLAKGKGGDDENKRMGLKKRAARRLYHLSTEDLKGPEKSNLWIKELDNDAVFNIQAYTECFISENLLRKYIGDKQIDYKQSSNIANKIKVFRNAEDKSKVAGNINITIRKNDDDLSYLDMGDLADLAENPPGGTPNTTPNTVVADGKEYRPIRNAVMHTALLTDQSRLKLTSVYNNIKARIKMLLSGSPGTYETPQTGGIMNLKWTVLIPLTKANVDNLKKLPGVYRLIYYDATEKTYRVYYVGQAKDLSKGLFEHLPGNETKKCCKEYLNKHYCYFRAAPISKQSDRDGVEVALYDKYEPECVGRKPDVDPIEIE